MVLLALTLLVTPALGMGLYFEDPNTSNTFTADDDDDHITYNFKSDGGAWVNIMNPWGTSAYLVLEPGEGFVQSLIVTFEIEDYDGGADGYLLMGGFGINGFSPSLWALGSERPDNLSWETVFGEPYYYYIEGDGVYEFIISFRHAMDWFGEQDNGFEKPFIESIDCLELGIFDPPKDTTMKLTILGLEETGDIFTFDHISRPLGSDKFYTPASGGGAAIIDPPSVDPTSPAAETPTDAPATDPPVTNPPPAGSNDADEDGGTWWIWMIACLGAGAVVAVIFVVLKKKA